jgi:hypothetical protein
VDGDRVEADLAKALESITAKPAAEKSEPER